MALGQTLLVDRPRTGITVATLNRPDQLNALTFGMFDDLAQLAADIAADDGARVLVLTGAGRGFRAGLDLADAATLPIMTAARLLEGQERWPRARTTWWRPSRPSGRSARPRSPAADACAPVRLSRQQSAQPHRKLECICRKSTGRRPR